MQARIVVGTVMALGRRPSAGNVTRFFGEGGTTTQSYGELAKAAAQGEIPGSSAGGEQPKFTAFAMTPDGPRHVIVKFSEPDQGLVQEFWRDLLLAEHLA